MSLVGILVALLILGVVLYIINLVPADPTVKKIMIAIAILFVVLWLLQAIGLFSFGNLKLS